MAETHASEEKTRLKKRAALEEKNITPYPSWNENRLANQNFLDRFSLLDASRAVTLAGRIMSLRVQGGTTFAHIKDEGASVQLFFKKDRVGDAAYQLLKGDIDRGDIIAATGTPFTTKRGEKSLLVSLLTLLAKSILPLPEKWEGLKEVETRFRKRYLDMLANDEVAHRFKIKSGIISAIREFLNERGYTEVETPVLQPLYGGGLARPFATRHNALSIDLYLRISPELYLKRLVVGGLEKVYEIGKVFRNEGIDRDHNPEFTALETMAAYHNYYYNMDLIEECYEFCAQKILGTTDIPYGEETIHVARPWTRMTMVDAISHYTGVNVKEWGSLAEAEKALIKQKIDKKKMKNMHSIGQAIALLFEEKVEEQLIQPTIIYEHPVETSPLAKRCPGNPAFVERFEHYILGSEHGNHYTELNDPVELAERFVEEQKKAKKGTAVEDVHQPDYDFLEAIKHGMPPTSGLSIGIDRMAMLFTNADNIKEVIPFPVLRPKSSK